MTLPFSKRYGYAKASDIIQIESMSDDLQNSLWNIMLKYYFNNKNKITNVYGTKYILSGELNKTVEEYWINCLKKPVDQIKNQWDFMYKKIREMFFAGDWYFIYDLIEYFANNNYKEIYDARKEKLLFTGANILFMNACNKVLETECSGYRFVENYITPITDPVEIQEIETAISKAQKEAQTHLNKALQSLSDKNGPKTKYKDSIRESIHAVEAICTKVTSQNTLGAALKDITKNGKVKIHPALNDAFQKIYGYTNDESGIRHHEKFGTGSDVSFEDAKFMLVAASAFINYLTIKIDKAELKP
ncbi:AbiJ-NTD4 domain-containing protein [Candidatus Margulisiibacteriota bacterium]